MALPYMTQPQPSMPPPSPVLADDAEYQYQYPEYVDNEALDGPLTYPLAKDNHDSHDDKLLTYIEKEYWSKYSDAGDFEADRDVDKAALAKAREELDLFSDELTTHADHWGCISLAYWSLSHIFETYGCCGSTKKQQTKAANEALTHVFPRYDGNPSQRAGFRLINVACWMLMTICAQIILYVALSWAIIEGAINFPRDGDLAAGIAPRSLCPGRDDHSVYYGANYHQDDWKANMPQNLAFAALMLVVGAATAFDWMRSHKMFRQYMRATGPESLLAKFNLSPATPRLFVLLEQKYKRIVAFDFFMHIVMTVVMLLLSVYAVFYVTTVGKMFAIVFAFQFLEKSDDVAKQMALDTTPLAKWIYYTEKIACRNKEPHRAKHSFFYLLAMFLYHCCYLCVYAIILWSLVWTGLGCKPGRLNALDFF